MNKLQEAFSAMRKDGNGLTLTQEQIILEAVRKQSKEIQNLITGYFILTYGEML